MGRALTLKDIANILEIKESYASKLVDEMIGEFNNSRIGLRIIRVKDKCQLTT